MSTPSKDLKTLGYVLRRTNYGEADRILNVITPSGKIAAIARGVRREKSKLAGGVEMFCLVELGVHYKNDEMGIVTSAQMKKYHQNIIKDLARLELAAVMLKKINNVAEHSDSPEFFEITSQVLDGLDAGLNVSVVESWFWLNLARASGEEINLYRDGNGAKLGADKQYAWDAYEKVLKEQSGGNIGAREIKLMRLMLSAKLGVVARVKNITEMILPILNIGKSVNML